MGERVIRRSSEEGLELQLSPEGRVLSGSDCYWLAAGFQSQEQTSTSHLLTLGLLLYCTHFGSRICTCVCIRGDLSLA